MRWPPGRERQRPVPAVRAAGADRTGIGLGLAFSRWGVEANSWPTPCARSARKGMHLHGRPAAARQFPPPRACSLEGPRGRACAARWNARNASRRRTSLLRVEGVGVGLNEATSFDVDGERLCHGTSSRRRGRYCVKTRSTRAPALTSAGGLDWTGVRIARRVPAAGLIFCSGRSRHQRHASSRTAPCGYRCSRTREKRR